MNIANYFFRYFPFGADGMLAGASTVFFAYIGFDSVASTAEEVCSVISRKFVFSKFNLTYPLTSSFVIFR